MNTPAAVANMIWRAACYPDWNRFRRALNNPVAAQKAVLEEILERMRGTDGSPVDFENLEPQGWAGYEPLVLRSTEGEKGLFGQHEIRRFVPTGGSERGSKLIPYTKLLERQFQRGIRAWVYELFRSQPSLSRGPAYWSISPALPAKMAPCGVPIGFDEDSAYLGGLGKRIVDVALAVPGSIRFTRSSEYQRSTLLLLLAQPELRLISVWSPTFLISLMKYYHDHRDELHSELAAGTVILGRRLKRKVGAWPWPKLGLISCWTDGQAGLWLDELQQLFPQVPIRGKGLISTEAFVSLPYGKHRPLAVTSHYLEFEFDSGNLCQVWDLKEGDEAVLVVTTGGGLMRYRLGDRVVVSGFEQKTPTIRFLGRQGRISDRFGEKLSDAFVARAIRKLGLTGFAMLAPNDTGYTLYTDAAVVPEALERALRENIHYQWAVTNGQMSAATVCVVKNDALRIYQSRCEKRGQKPGDIKPVALDLEAGWQRWFSPNKCTQVLK